MRKLQNARWFVSFIIAGFLLIGGAPFSLAQQGGSQIFTLNQDQLYNRSLFGKRVLAQVAKRSTAITNENTRMEAQLKDEELALTKKRPSLTPKDFRVLADSFDVKVEKIRTGQAQKSADLNAWVNDERQRFFNLAFPVLVKLASEIGALAILDRRSVILSSDSIDITDKALKKIDVVLKNGAISAKE